MTNPTYICTDRLTVGEMGETFDQLDASGSPLFHELRAHAKALDQLTHGHSGCDIGWLERLEAEIADSLPVGFRLESGEAELGEHRTRAVGSRIVTIFAPNGERCVAEWSGHGTRLTLKVLDDFNPGERFQLLGHETEGVQRWRVLAGSRAFQTILVRAGGADNEPLSIDCLRPPKGRPRVYEGKRTLAS